MKSKRAAKPKSQKMCTKVGFQEDVSLHYEDDATPDNFESSQFTSTELMQESPGRPLPYDYGYTTGPMFEHPTHMYQNQPSADPAYLSPAKPSMSSKTPHLHRQQSDGDMDISTMEEYSGSRSPVESLILHSKHGPQCYAKDELVPDPMEHSQPSPGYGEPCQQSEGTSSLVPFSSTHPQTYQPQAGTIDGHVGDRLTGRKARGPRGQTPCLDFLNNIEKIPVSVTGGGEPVGSEVSKLTRFLCIIARDGHKAPLNYIKWPLVPDEKKEMMWEDVLSKFHIDPKSKDWVLKSIGLKWKAWKAKLKANHYITNKRVRPECVLPDQWQFLVTYWNTEAAKYQSDKNKAIRVQAHQKTTHAVGQKSFDRLRKEKRLKRPDGKSPSRAEMCELTSSKKNGHPMNATASAAISKCCEKRKQQEAPEGCCIHGALTQVNGQEMHGYVPTFGLGPSNDFGGPSHAEAMELAATAIADVKEMKKKVVSMETQMANMMSTISYLQKQLSGKDRASTKPSQVSDVSIHSGDLPSATDQNLSSKQNPAQRSKTQCKSTSKDSQRKG